jgi:hypothetical protein
MSTDESANLTLPRWRKQALRSIPLMVFSMVLVLVASTPALGQMGSSVWYSDSWVVDDSSNPPYYIYGSGITSDSYNSYGHRYWVSTTLTSPTGRSAYGSSYTSATYARVDVSLSWDFETGETGDFTISTTHSMTCPYIYGTVSSTSGDILGISIAVTNYIHNGGCVYYLYCPNGNASVTCPANNPVYVNPSQNICRNYLHDYRLKYRHRNAVVCFPVGKAELAEFPLNCS